MKLRPEPSWTLLFAGEAAVFGWLGYRDAMLRHQWTAASVGLGLAFVLVAFAAALGFVLGAAVTRSRQLGRPGAARALQALGAALMVWAGVRVSRNRALEAHLDAVRRGPVTLEQARRLESGSLDERRALAYNRACPPAVLAELGASEDWATRAAAAGNPSTPAATLDALARDRNESVRLYLSYNPARKK